MPQQVFLCIFLKENFMYRITLLLLLAANYFTAAAQKDLKAVSFAAHKFSISIPAVMDTMPADKIMLKYNKKPDAKSQYYANADYSFSIVMDEIAADITEDMLEPLKPQLLQQLGKQKLTENRSLNINGHKLIAVAFSSEVPGNKIFNRRIFFVAGKKLFSIAYNTTEADLAKRKAVIESSIRSLQIK